MSDVLAGNAPHRGELLGGRYALEERIGEGGMAVVYRARDERLGRTVAVKIFRGAADATANMARNESETRLLASLNHPSLVTLFDAHLESDGPAFLVMEHVDGPTLRSRIGDGALDPAQVAAMARDLAEALHVVHQAGVVHRDIKPSNVLLRPSHTQGGEYLATLADFGIAYLVDSTRITTPGTLIGTAAYLSPEQVLGEPPAPASDVYSLGLVLLESLTGKRAFPQTGAAEVALARLNRGPEIPSEFGYGWRSLLSAMTARNPQERPSALEVVLSAREMDQPDSEPESTRAMTAPTRKFTASTVEISSGDDANPPVPTEAQSAPRRFGDDPGSATAETARVTTPFEVLPAARNSVRPRWRRWWLVVAALGLVALGIGIAVAIWSAGLSAADSPAPVPSLPTLTEPLNSDMKQLLESVTP